MSDKIKNCFNKKIKNGKTTTTKRLCIRNLWKVKIKIKIRIWYGNLQSFQYNIKVLNAVWWLIRKNTPAIFEFQPFFKNSKFKTQNSCEGWILQVKCKMSPKCHRTDSCCYHTYLLISHRKWIWINCASKFGMSLDCFLFLLSSN